jgi:hypothetical protein
MFDTIILMFARRLGQLVILVGVIATIKKAHLKFKQDGRLALTSMRGRRLSAIG